MRQILLFLAVRELFSLIAAHLVDMPLEIAVREQSCHNVLFEGGNGAGVKSEPLVKISDELLRQYHISDSQRGGDRFGKRVEIDHVAPRREREKGVLGLGGDRKFGFKIVLDDVSLARA